MATTSISPLPIQRFTDSNGAPLSGGLLFCYIAGTTTKQITYTDSTGNTPNTNPVVLNSRGEANVWFTQGLAYKFTLSPSTDTDPPSNPIWTVDNIQPGVGVIANGTVLGNSSGSPSMPTVQTLGAGLAFQSGALTPVLRGYLAGLTLSNDSGSPNTVLDVSAGVCTDSTNAVSISLGAFTKSTAGTWVAGTGNNGMGNGLTIAVSTYYHVFAIINAGVADVYFDTSVSAANKPASTTAFRRIGSFVTDSSAHITAFLQYGDTFVYITPPVSFNSTVNTVSAITVSVPTGLNVIAILFVQAVAANVWQLGIGGAGGTVLTNVVALINAASVSAAGQFSVIANTSAQVVVSVSVNPTTVEITTMGWIDTRGRFA